MLAPPPGATHVESRTVESSMRGSIFEISTQAGDDKHRDRNEAHALKGARLHLGD